MPKTKRFRLTKKEALALEPGTWVVVPWYPPESGPRVCLVLEHLGISFPGPARFNIWEPECGVIIVEHTEIRGILGKVIVPSLPEAYVKKPKGKYCGKGSP